MSKDDAKPSTRTKAQEASATAAHTAADNGATAVVPAPAPAAPTGCRPLGTQERTQWAFPAATLAVLATLLTTTSALAFTTSVSTAWLLPSTGSAVVVVTVLVPLTGPVPGTRNTTVC